LILIGVLYLLNSLDLINFRQIGRFWPVILIVIGAYMLYNRIAPGAPAQVTTPPDPGQPYPGQPVNPNPNAAGTSSAPGTAGAPDTLHGERL
jgi:hypothetical protein